MITNLLIASDLIDAVANPSNTVEQHEMGAARLAVLAAHGAPIDALSMEGASAADIALLSGHVCRWALNEAKRVPGHELEVHLPEQAILQELFFSETDRVCRLLLMESVVTHPETERKLVEFDERSEPTQLERLPDTWPRNYLIELCGREDRESSGREDDDTLRGDAAVSLTELGMLLLQIATPAALTFLGGTVMTLTERGRENHPLLVVLRTFLTGHDNELAQRLGLQRRPDRFR